MAILRPVLDFLLPRQCIHCKDRVAGEGGLCIECWDEARWLRSPFCHICAIPIPHDCAEGTVCAGCLTTPPEYDIARSVWLYGGVAKDLILAYKHGDATHLAPHLSLWAGRAGSEILGLADAIVPVPLHWTRLWKRRYNQSALLARLLARKSAIPFWTECLVRHKRTESQGGKNASQRARNVRNVFNVPLDWHPRLHGKRILLVDDVYTTGATVNACARVLKKAGAQAVDVLTLARVDHHNSD